MHSRWEISAAEIRSLTSNYFEVNFPERSFPGATRRLPPHRYQYITPSLPIFQIPPWQKCETEETTPSAKCMVGVRSLERSMEFLYEELEILLQSFARLAHYIFFYINSLTPRLCRFLLDITVIFNLDTHSAK